MILNFSLLNFSVSSLTEGGVAGFLKDLRSRFLGTASESRDSAITTWRKTRNFLDSTEVRETSIRARTRAVEVLLHAPFSVYKGEFLIANLSARSLPAYGGEVLS